MYDLDEIQRLRDRWEPKLGGDKNSSGGGSDGGDKKEVLAIVGPVNKQRGRIGRGSYYVGKYTGRLANYVQTRARSPAPSWNSTIGSAVATGFVGAGVGTAVHVIWALAAAIVRQACAALSLSLPHYSAITLFLNPPPAAFMISEYALSFAVIGATTSCVPWGELESSRFFTCSS